MEDLDETTRIVISNLLGSLSTKYVATFIRAYWRAPDIFKMKLTKFLDNKQLTDWVIARLLYEGSNSVLKTD